MAEKEYLREMLNRENHTHRLWIRSKEKAKDVYKDSKTGY